MEGTKKTKKKMEKEAFRELSKDMLPLLNQMNDCLKKHGVEELTNVSMCTDGYISFSTHNTDWEMIRCDADSPVRIKCSMSEDL